MMEWSHRYWRFMMRLLSKQAMVYTEMVVGDVVVHTDNLAEHLGFSPEEHPIACQLGGSDPDLLAHAAGVATGFGYDEINLNCGCPSNRVAHVRGGAPPSHGPCLVMTTLPRGPFHPRREAASGPA